MYSGLSIKFFSLKYSKGWKALGICIKISGKSEGNKETSEKDGIQIDRQQKEKILDTFKIACGKGKKLWPIIQHQGPYFQVLYIYIFDLMYMYDMKSSEGFCKYINYPVMSGLSQKNNSYTFATHFKTMSKALMI